MISQWRSILFLTIFSYFTVVLSEAETTDWTAYERGSLGVYPQVHFKTTETTAPLVHINQWNSSCDSGYIFISPHHDRVADNRIYMLDEQGHLVWYHEERGSLHNVQVQRYKGRDYITYWVGDDSFHGHGAGYYKMVSVLSFSSYGLQELRLITHILRSTKHTTSPMSSTQPTDIPATTTNSASPSTTPL